MKILISALFVIAFVSPALAQKPPANSLAIYIYDSPAPMDIALYGNSGQARELYKCLQTKKDMALCEGEIPQGSYRFSHVEGPRPHPVTFDMLGTGVYLLLVSSEDRHIARYRLLDVEGGQTLIAVHFADFK